MSVNVDDLELQTLKRRAEDDAAAFADLERDHSRALNEIAGYRAEISALRAELDREAAAAALWRTRTTAAEARVADLTRERDEALRAAQSLHETDARSLFERVARRAT